MAHARCLRSQLAQCLGAVITDAVQEGMSAAKAATRLQSLRVNRPLAREKTSYRHSAAGSAPRTAREQHLPPSELDAHLRRRLFQTPIHVTAINAAKEEYVQAD